MVQRSDVEVGSKIKFNSKTIEGSIGFMIVKMSLTYLISPLFIFVVIKSEVKKRARYSFL